MDEISLGRQDGKGISVCRRAAQCWNDSIGNKWFWVQLSRDAGIANTKHNHGLFCHLLGVAFHCWSWHQFPQERCFLYVPLIYKTRQENTNLVDSSAPISLTKHSIGIKHKCYKKNIFPIKDDLCQICIICITELDVSNFISIFMSTKSHVEWQILLDHMRGCGMNFYQLLDHQEICMVFSSFALVYGFCEEDRYGTYWEES